MEGTVCARDKAGIESKTDTATMTQARKALAGLLNSGGFTPRILNTLLPSFMGKQFFA
jgi:hypothetical protein